VFVPDCLLQPVERIAAAQMKPSVGRKFFMREVLLESSTPSSFPEEPESGYLHFVV
jgi:hypothetical protein